MSHSICTHRGQVNSRLLVFGNHIANLISDPSFCHNLCYRCPNGSCEAILDIYISITFQWLEERFKARCFDPCNRTLKFRESRRTPKSPFWECECHFHILPKSEVVTPTWESWDKMTFGCWSHGQTYNILYGGRWWLPPSLGRGESCESVFTCGSFVHQSATTTH